MKPKKPLLISCPPRHAAQAPFGGLAETGAGGVRCLLVPILLNGGFGYGNLRLHAPLAVDAAQHPSSDDNYPPCNVEQLGEDRYQISLALAGFAPDEIGITAEQNVLTVEGRKAAQAQREFLYQGISSRPFKRQFNLADYVQVRGATFDNGLLHIELVREIPEAMKPRRIAINGAPASNVREIETKAA